MDLHDRAVKLIKDLPKMSVQGYIDASCSLIADLLIENEANYEQIIALSNDVNIARGRTREIIKESEESKTANNAKLAEIHALEEDNVWQIKQNVKMYEVIQKAVKYLDTNNLTNIMHGSILHQNLKDALVTESVYGRACPVEPLIISIQRQ